MYHLFVPLAVSHPTCHHIFISCFYYLDSQTKYPKQNNNLSDSIMIFHRVVWQTVNNAKDLDCCSASLILGHLVWTQLRIRRYQSDSREAKTSYFKLGLSRISGQENHSLKSVFFALLNRTIVYRSFGPISWRMGRILRGWGCAGAGLPPSTWHHLQRSQAGESDTWHSGNEQFSISKNIMFYT